MSRNLRKFLALIMATVAAVSVVCVGTGTASAGINKWVGEKSHTFYA